LGIVSKTLSQKQNKKPKDWEHSLSGRVLAQKVQGPGFRPHISKQPKQKAPKTKNE
jgi:hypothetical protein